MATSYPADATSSVEKADSGGSLLQLPFHNPSVAPEKLGEWMGVTITNAFTMAILGLVMVIALCLWARSFKVDNPGKGQLMVEGFMDGLANFFTGVVGKKEVAKQVVPIVASMSLFIILENLVAIVVPIVPAFTYHGHYLFRPHNSDLNAALAMAISMFVLANVYGISKVGFLNHFSRFITIDKVIKGFKEGAGAGFMSLITFAVGLLEMVGELAKVLSLSLRLFGNIFAGEVLLLVMLSLFGPLLPIPILVLGLLVGVIQAIVFSSLTAAKFAEFSTKH